MNMREAIKAWDKYRNLSEVERRQTRNAMYRVLGKVAKEYFAALDRPVPLKRITERVPLRRFRRTKWPAVDTAVADALRAGGAYRVEVSKRLRIYKGEEYVVAAMWLGWETVLVHYVD